MKNYKQIFDELEKEISKVIVGQQDVVEQILVAVLCDGNALLEGYPGLAKTMTVRTLAELMDLKFSRIQNTPDLMPSDITGTYIIEESSGKRQFKFQPGPIFANVVLADEINRATPKTQSALLEAMQEKQVTVGTQTFKLDLPFFVLATMNPIEQEGSLALDQPVYIDGKFVEGRSLIKRLESERCEVIESNGKRLYKIPNSYTSSLNFEGKIVKSKCWMYTLPFSGQLITLQTEGGRKISVTSNHPFVTEQNSIYMWKKAEQLQLNDVLTCPASSKIKEELDGETKHENLGYSQSTLLTAKLDLYPDIISEKIISLKSKKFSGKVFGLVVPGLQNYIAGFGGCGINHNTYPLPEAQADRFLLKIKVNYPSYEQELLIVDKYASEAREHRLKVMLNKNHLLTLQGLTRQVPIANDIKQRAVKIVLATRANKEIIQYGASPRASIGMILAAKARALIEGRNHVSNEDLNALSYPILRHRIILNFEAERRGISTDDAIKEILKQIK